MALFPSFIPKSGRPANSPDLNPLDFFVWGHAQKMINDLEEAPATQVELQKAIRKAISSIPLDMVRKAIDSVYARCRLCVVQEGDTFKHMLKSAIAKSVTSPPRASEPAAAAESATVIDEPIENYAQGEKGPEEEDQAAGDAEIEEGEFEGL